MLSPKPSQQWNCRPAPTSSLSLKHHKQQQPCNLEQPWTTTRLQLPYQIHATSPTLTEFQQKEPCLTPTLMDEGQARNPNTTYNGYKMEFRKFALTWKLICPVQHKIIQKEQKETNKKGGISLTIMGQNSIYNSIHKPQKSPN